MYRKSSVFRQLIVNSVALHIYRHITDNTKLEERSFIVKAKKARDSYRARLTGKPDQPSFTIIAVAADWQDPVVL